MELSFILSSLSPIQSLPSATCSRSIISTAKLGRPPREARQHMVPSLNTEWCDSLTQRERDRIRGKERQKCLATRG